MGTVPRKRRRHFSLNGLAIQISAFALSFTLVALLVVGSSRAAFVDENETVTGRVPSPTSQSLAPTRPPGEPATPTEAPTPTEEPAPSEEPVPTPIPLPEPGEEPPLPAEITLTDDAAGTAMFGGDSAAAGVLTPGVPLQRCIRVSVDGAVGTGPVVLYAAEARGALAPYLDMAVEVGPGGSGPFGDCAGFVATSTVFAGTLESFGASHASYDRGLPAWQPDVSGDARSFRVTLTLRDDPAAEGLSAGFGFSWQMRG